MDFSRLGTALDNLATKGLPVRIIFDEMSVLKIAASVLIVVVIVTVAKKFI